MKKRIGLLLALSLLLCILCLLPSCKDQAPQGGDKVIVSVRDYGDVVIELYPDAAPVTVENFKKLVSEGYYDGTTFHRIINGFMIQGGKGGSASTIKGEFSANGVNNPIKHERGVISMARAKSYDSASSQFFICQTTEGCKHLDGYYAAFGRVIEGMEVVDRIAAVVTDGTDAPVTPVVIDSILFYGVVEEQK